MVGKQIEIYENNRWSKYDIIKFTTKPNQHLLQNKDGLSKWYKFKRTQPQVHEIRLINDVQKVKVIKLYEHIKMLFLNELTRNAILASVESRKEECYNDYIVNLYDN